MEHFKISLGVPNGSLLNPTLELLKKIGIHFTYEDRVFEAEVEGSEIINKIKFFRPQDIPMAIKNDAIEAGICGWDCVKEANMERKIFKIAELNYSKRTKKPVDIVIFCKEGSRVDPARKKGGRVAAGKAGNLTDTEEISVTSEYLNITKEVFEKATVTFSHGSTESKVIGGLYDYGVCVTETGKSLKRNGLKIVKKIFSSPTVLMAGKKTEEIVFFGELLKGALKAEKYQLIKMNASKEVKGAIIDILPSLLSPTINELSQGAYAIETVVEKNKLAKLIIALQKVGATDILVMDINVLV